jgi:hypothetical protein
MNQIFHIMIYSKKIDYIIIHCAEAYHYPMPSIDHSLETLIRADYYITKLMTKLAELVTVEYSNENYGETSKRCVQWLKLYRIMVHKYKDYIRDGTEHINRDKYYVEESHESKRWDAMMSALRTKMYDRILIKYMDCHKFLVGPKVFDLVQQINTALPNEDNWTVFTSFRDMVVEDGGVNQSDERTMLLSMCSNVLSHALRINRTIENFPIVEILEKMRFKTKIPITIVEAEPDYVYVSSSPLSSTSTVPERLSIENAKLGMVISYATKKSVEYGKIVAIKPTYVEITRLQQQDNGSFVPHKVAVCKASKNKPAFQRLISIVSNA